MKLLELFCGTKSVSKAVGHQFDEVVTLDIDRTANPTFCANILEWDYTMYPPGYFHTVWASPPCTEFSRLNHALPNKVPNLDLADSIVKKTIEIIEYFNPERFYIENPQSGTLKEREYMIGLPYIDIDYCRFSDWGYKKRTRFWTTEDLHDVLCQGCGICPNMEGKKHVCAIGNSTYKEFWNVKGKRLEQRYAIPGDLIRYLFSI